MHETIGALPKRSYSDPDPTFHSELEPNFRILMHVLGRKKKSNLFLNQKFSKRLKLKKLLSFIILKLLKLYLHEHQKKVKKYEPNAIIYILLQKKEES